MQMNCFLLQMLNSEKSEALAITEINLDPALQTRWYLDPINKSEVQNSIRQKRECTLLT